MIFRQLLDISRSKCYTNNLPNYALSLLVLEVSQEYIEQRVFSENRKTLFNNRMEEIISWINANYSQELSLTRIAEQFKYNPNYLSSAFAKYTGQSIMKYILKIRIEAAKKMLIVSTDIVKEIAYKCGFNDERIFMKRFKRSEDITPIKYRNAFSRIKLVN
jgi:transcriptional regulator GlxA family with amidase domain